VKSPRDVVDYRCGGCRPNDEQCIYCAIAQGRDAEAAPGYEVEERDLTEREWLEFKRILKGLE
jgi:hypothetical protein